MIKMLGTLPSPIASTNTQTVLTIPLSFPAGILPDATFASVSIQNGTNATLTQIALTFTPIVGGIPLALAYPVTVSVAAGAATTVQVPLTNGLDEAPSLTLTFASAPTSGNCAARVVLMPHAPQVGLTGSYLNQEGNAIRSSGWRSLPITDFTNQSIAAGSYQQIGALDVPLSAKTLLIGIQPSAAGVTTCTVGWGFGPSNKSLFRGFWLAQNLVSAQGSNSGNSASMLLSTPVEGDNVYIRVTNSSSSTAYTYSLWHEFQS